MWWSDGQTEVFVCKKLCSILFSRVSDPVWYWPDPDPTSQDKPDLDPDPTSNDKPDPDLDPTSQDKLDPDPDTSVFKIFHLFYDEF